MGETSLIGSGQKYSDVDLAFATIESVRNLAGRHLFDGFLIGSRCLMYLVIRSR